MLAPTLLYEDTHLIVLSKPAGLLSQGEKTGDENLVDWLRVYLGRNFVGLVHRLDRNTSGVMVVAKRSKSAQRLTDQLQSGKLERTYLAWVQGTLTDQHVWAHHLWKDSKKNTVHVVTASHPRGHPASLLATPIGRGVFKGLSLTLVEFMLQTGRSHQIRVQSAHEKHPLLGDHKYGGSTLFPRPALHSHRLAFEHPMSGEIMQIGAPLPQDMAAIEILPLGSTFK